MIKKILLLLIFGFSYIFAAYSIVTIGPGSSLNITGDESGGKAYLIHGGDEEGKLIVVGALNSWSPDAIINFGITGDGDIALPVQLSTFSCSLDKGAVILRWHTESEVNNLGFNIYRKTSTEDYKKINNEIIEGAGNSSVGIDYETTDVGVVSGDEYTYLIEDISYENVSKKHNDLVVTINIEAFVPNLPEKFVLQQSYPNPFNPSTTITYSIIKDSNVKLSIYDVSGREIETLVNESQIIGNYSVHWNASAFPSGMYIYKIETEEFSDLKKCMLIK